MNRQQRRTVEKSNSKSNTYVLTKEQFDKRVHSAVEKEIMKHKDDLMTDAINTSLSLLLTLPLEVLMDHYWKKSYEKRIPEFTEYVLEYYRKWQNGELDMEKLKNDLWEYGHVKLEVEE